jgi:hypothetical protein
VAPSCAVDAFYHPYAYATRRAETDCRNRVGAKIGDG